MKQRLDKWAAELNRRTQHWNQPSKLTALTAFIIAFGSACIYLIIKSL